MRYFFMSGDRYVLIADNSSEYCDIMKNVLEKEFHVITTQNLSDTQNILKNPPDMLSCIIYNINIIHNINITSNKNITNDAGKDNLFYRLKFLNEIKCNPNLCDIPVIVIGSEENCDSGSEELQAGADDFLVIPQNMKIFLQKIINIIKKHEDKNTFIRAKLQSNHGNSRICLKNLLDNISSGVIIAELNDNINIVFQNQSFIKILGINDDINTKQKVFEFFSFIHNDDLKKLYHDIKEFTATDSAFLGEYRFIRQNGDTRWMKLNGSFINYYDETIPAMIFTAEDITEQKANRNMLAFRADHDILTGIFNKDAFCRMTKQLLHANNDISYVLLLWNVERFKLINDLFGREKGDLLLQKMAEATKKYVGSNGTYGRIEADRFAICLPKNLLNISALEELSERFSEELQINHVIVNNIGIFEIDDINLPVDQMCDRATLALQTVKGNYNIHYAFYDNSLRTAMLYEQNIRDEMTYALETHQFQIYLQPIYSLSENAPVGAECLVRWIHPEKGIISPGLFIPVFERNGFIAKLDKYVWEEACHYLQKRRAAGKTLIPLSVNVSRVSLYNPNLAEEINELIDSHEIDHSLIKFEVTETAYNDNPEQLIQTVTEMKNSGFAVLMDDFGSGFSSLNMLKDIPVDVLKIDMKFLHGFENGGRVGTIVTSIIRMTRWLGIRAIAEGVEMKDQLDFLRSIGCDRIQGYYFARPMPCDDFENYLEHHIPVYINYTSTSTIQSDFDMLLGGNPIFTKILEGAFGGMGIFEIINGKIEMLRVNNGYYETSGYDPQSLMEGYEILFDGIYEQDAGIPTEACQKSIKTGESVRVMMRRYHRDGHLMHLDTIFTYLGGSDERPVFCITFSDMTSQIEYDLKMKQSMVQLETIMHYMNGGVGLFKIFDRKIETIFANPMLYKLNGYTREEIDKMENGIMTLVHPDDIGSLLGKIKTASEKRSIFEHDYRIILKNNTIKWRHITASHVPSEDDVPMFIAVFIDITETMQSESDRELTKYYPALSLAFNELISFDTISQTFMPLFSNLRGDEVFTTPQYYEKGFLEWLSIHAAPNEINEISVFANNLINTINANNIPEPDNNFVYTMVYPTGEIKIIRCVLKHIGVHRYLLCCSDILALMNIFSSNKEDEKEDKNNLLSDNLNENLPSGICVFDLTQGFKPIYINNRVFDILGLDRELIKDNVCDYLNIIFTENYDSLRNRLLSLKKENLPFEFRKSIDKLNGDNIWVNYVINITEENDGRIILYAVINDATVYILNDNNLKWRDERYRILVENSESIMFDYFVENDMLYYSVSDRDRETINYTVNNFKKNIKAISLIHPDSAELVSSTIEEAIKKPISGTVEFITNIFGKGYRWVRTKYISVYGSDNTEKSISHIIGKVDDIQHIKETEQRAEHLKQIAETDQMTGMLNRTATETRINEILKNRQNDYDGGVIFVVDFDNFKNINDTFGHLTGDAYLYEAASVIKSKFRKNDIVGRIGGDEFVVYIDNVSDLDAIKIKAEEILVGIQSISLPGLESTNCSIGIYLINEKDKEYHEIFKRADCALYHAKHRGKNRYVFYDAEIMNAPLSMITSPQRITTELDERVTNSDEQLLREVFHMLYRSENIEYAINNVLYYIGSFYNVSRVYIFEDSFDKKYMMNTFEWCNENISPEIENLRIIPYEAIGDIYVENFNNDGIFYCRSITELPKQHFEFLDAQGIKSMLQCAIPSENGNGKYCGFIGYDECTEKRFWTQKQVDTIVILSEFISTFLQKWRINHPLIQPEQ